VHLLDYVAVDYSGAVVEGRVVSDPEYREQRTFLTHVGDQLTALGVPQDDPMRAALVDLRRSVESLAAGETVARQARSLGNDVRVRFRLQALPPRVPSLEHGRQLYAGACAACHGATGHGDGPIAGTLDPVPADLTNRERMLALPLSAVFATISFGIDGTAMPSYEESFDDADRYDLTFFVGSLAFDSSDVARGAALAKDDPRTLAKSVAGISELILEPAESLARTGDDARALVAYARTHPEALASSNVSLGVVRERLDESWKAYLAGDARTAGELAVSAYLDGFEPVEPKLDALDPALRVGVEGEFLAYRSLVRDGAARSEVEAARDRLLARVTDAEDRLRSGDFGPAAAFVASLTVLAREGFEAVLVVVALCGLLIRARRREALRYVHAGWISASVAGVATWSVAHHLIAVSGAQRELVEGVSSLLACAILFYVSYWLIAKVSSTRWQSFLRTRIETALTRGSMWTLALIAFVAVYRELFETILFLEAITSQAGPAGTRAIVAGCASGLVLLALLALFAFRFGLRMPVRRFFVASSLLLYLLAVVLAGQGVAALQEAGRIPVTPVAFVRIEWLGIFPTLESLGLQAVLLVAAVVAAIWILVVRPRTAPASEYAREPVRAARYD
jgi:high-affinity iron transporter